MSTFLKKHWLKLLLASFVVEVMIFGWWVLKSDPYNVSPMTKEESVKALNESIAVVNDSVRTQLASVPQSLAEELAQTRLYFMLAPKNQGPVQSFVFENGSFSNPDDNKTEDKFYSYSSNGKKAAFFAIPDDRNTVPRDWGAQAQLYVASTGEGIDPAFPALDHAAVVDSTNIQYKQHPDVSDTGAVVYIGWDKPQPPEVEESNDWTIYFVKNGAATSIANGFMPKWRNNEEIYFIRNNGIHHLKVNSGEESELVMTSTELLSHSNNRIDISDDGSKLAWTQPDLNQIRLFTINANGSLSEIGKLTTRGYWVTFSPSGNYLAVETTSLTATGREEFPEAKVEFFDTKTMKKVPELEVDFDLFNQMNMYMTDWVIK